MNAFEQLKLWAKYNRVTAILIASSIIIALLSNFGTNLQPIHFLFISEYLHGLTEIINGEIWRLITPIIIHFGILHVAFNLFWLYQLGSAIEQRQTSKRMLILVVLIALLSNLSQFFWDGPLFGGMSGVVYGLLGYVWAQGKFNPGSGLGLDKSIAVMMLIWFVVCWLGLVGNIANMAHTVGLCCGVILGIIYSPRLFRNMKLN